MKETPDRTLDELTRSASLSLEDLVERRSLEEMIRALAVLVGLPLRLYGRDGVMLADASGSVDLYRYVNSFPDGPDRTGETIRQVKSVALGAGGEASYECITGAGYRIVGIQYDGGGLGRIIIGPYRIAAGESPLQKLLEAVPGLDAERVRKLASELPVADPATLDQLSSYVRHMLDMVLFSGHRALLTTNMHLVSVRESYRELREKNSKLQHAYERLKELDRLKSNFLATVSHELRTPLTSVIGYSEMLAAGIAGKLSSEQLEFVDTIRQKGEQLLELIKGLLDLSKLESGTMSLYKEQVDIAEIMADAGGTLRPMAVKKGVALVPQTENDVPTVWGDAGRLRQVVINLGENAIKFTPAGGTVQLLARATTLGGAGEDDGPRVLLAAARPAVEIRVADTGIGIPDAERERVFDSFYQVDSSSTRQQGGAGLGLAIVKRLVEAHDGTIRIEANRPCGTVVVVTVPSRKLSNG